MPKYRKNRTWKELIELAGASTISIQDADDKVQELFETSAEMRNSLVKAFGDYGKKRGGVAELNPGRPARKREAPMPQGDKSSYSDKQKRQAGHIEAGHEKKCGLGLP